MSTGHQNRLLHSTLHTMVDDFDKLAKLFTEVAGYTMDFVSSHPWTHMVGLRILWITSVVAVTLETWYFKWFPKGRTAFNKMPESFISVSTLSPLTLEYSETVYPDPDTVVALDKGNFDSVVITRRSCDKLVRVQRTVVAQNSIVKESSTRFLAVTYHHPDLEEMNVSLEIPEDMMVMGNELLSPAFVRRALNSLRRGLFDYKKIPFDERYCVQCIDDRIKFYTVHADEVLVLHEESCKVVKR